MAAVSSNTKAHYPPLKETAQPMCFGDVMTSQQFYPELAVRSRKRGYSTFSDEENITGASHKGLRSGSGGLVDGAKRVRTKRWRRELFGNDLVGYIICIGNSDESEPAGPTNLMFPIQLVSY